MLLKVVVVNFINKTNIIIHQHLLIKKLCRNIVFDSTFLRNIFFVFIIKEHLKNNVFLEI